MNQLASKDFSINKYMIRRYPCPMEIALGAQITCQGSIENQQNFSDIVARLSADENCFKEFKVSISFGNTANQKIDITDTIPKDVIEFLKGRFLSMWRNGDVKTSPQSQD